MDRNKKILIVLILILGIAVIYRIRHPFRQETVSQLTYGPGKATRMITMKIKPEGESPLNATPSRLTIARFPEAPTHSGAVYKNPFFIQKNKSVQETVIPVEAEEENEEPLSIDPLSLIKEELSRFTVLGLYENKFGKTVFLQRGKEMLMVRVGDRIDGKYRVKEITNHSIAILAEAVNETIYIDMEAF